MKTEPFTDTRCCDDRQDRRRAAEQRAAAAEAELAELRKQKDLQ